MVKILQDVRLMYKLYFKSLIDIIVASIGLLLVSPILLVLTTLLFVVNRGNPFFIQTRPGKKGKSFRIIKFKTMTDKRNLYGQLLPDAERLTSIGAFIRKTSLDELPQLINVLKGDISLVGPRPLLMEYLPLYNKEQFRRHDVKPGITGWAQVNGRNAISWEEKFRFDLEYVENYSFSMDCKIIIMTIKKVLLREGISASDHVTMKYFKGNEL